VRSWSEIETDAESLAYADSSALVKLVLLEPETGDLRAYLDQRAPRLITSRLSIVEVTRATIISVPDDRTRANARRLLSSCLLVDVSAGLVDTASQLASAHLRTLDAIHLATALDVGPDVVITYDRRLAEAAEAARLGVVSPGR
jgi:predicted nucleic acid-binding protein